MSNKATDMQVLREHMFFHGERIKRITEIVKYREENKNASHKYFSEREAYFETVKKNPEIDSLFAVRAEMDAAKKMFDADYGMFRQAEKELEASQAAQKMLEAAYESGATGQPLDLDFAQFGSQAKKEENN